MQVPTIIQGQFVNEDKSLSKQATNMLEQLLQNMQRDLGQFGFNIPSVSSDPASVTPNATGGQLAQVQATFGKQDGIEPGTVIYDPYTDQLKVLLNNSGTPAFKTITTS